jgi:RNA polymerase sigma factor (sigma-70 family)
MSTVRRMRDPLAHPATLIRRVYAYVAYRIGDGHDAEDVTSTTIERALRYRSSFDPRKGDPISWVIGIARTCVNDHLRERRRTTELDDQVAAHGNLETDVLRRLTVARALGTLDERERDLVALRYGADLSAGEIGRLLDMRPNAVDVALHRTRERLRPELAVLDETTGRRGGSLLARPAPGHSS